jgi:hypothetical protein
MLYVGGYKFVTGVRLRAEAYHVEGNDMFEGDFAGLVFLDEDFINLDGRGAGWESEDKGVFSSWSKGFDSIFLEVREGREGRGRRGYR